MGHEVNGDTMSGRNIGGYQCVSTIDPKGSTRSHAGVAYYAPAAGRPNLEVLTDVLVEKVLFKKEKDDCTVIGVRLYYEGQSFDVNVRKEIILSAGTFASPCLLERSGIGSRSLLERLGIEVLVENANVGENLQDHIMCGISYEVTDDVETADVFRDPANIGPVMQEYQTSGTGLLAAPPSSFAYLPITEFLEAEGKIHLKSLLDQHLSEDKTDQLTEAEKLHHAFVRKVLESPDEASGNTCMIFVQVHMEESPTEKLFALSSPGKYATIITALAHPFSRGHVHSTSKDAKNNPRIDPKYMTHPLDIEIFARHVSFIHTIAGTPPFSKFLKQNGLRIPTWATRGGLEESKRLVKEASMSNYHPCGTCAMLPRERGGVVDDRLRVYGVKGLRVCDASIMPIIPRGNIMSSVYTIAEKGSDIIKEDLGLEMGA